MTKKLLILLPLLLITFHSAMALRFDSKNYYLEDGIAVGGYDPVSYFEENKAVEGKKKYSLTENGITFLFSSQKNLDLFKNNPGKYEPEFGGWCAYAMADGEKVEIDPESYKIKDGKLYLFFKAFYSDTKKKWNKNEAELEPKAHQLWKKNFEP